jgi:hypothetical protein
VTPGVQSSKTGRPAGHAAGGVTASSANCPFIENQPLRVKRALGFSVAASGHVLDFGFWVLDFGHCSLQIQKIEACRSYSGSFDFTFWGLLRKNPKSKI